MRHNSKLVSDDTPLVSVIIPCYNQGRFLSECILSLQAQTYSNWEAIIVNDGSTDNTQGIAFELRELDQRVKYIEHENRGLSAARNSGITAANGEYFQFLDSDDLIEPNKILSQLEFLKKNNKLTLVFSDVRYFMDGNVNEKNVGPYASKDGLPWVPALWAKDGTMLQKLVTKNVMAVNCPLIPRKVLELVGPWNELINALEDWEYWIRCAYLNVNFIFDNHLDGMALVRMHPSSMTNDSDRMLLANVDVCISTYYCFTDLNSRYGRFSKGLYALERLKCGGLSKRYFNMFIAFNEMWMRNKIAKSYLRYLTGRFLRLFSN